MASGREVLRRVAISGAAASITSALALAAAARAGGKGAAQPLNATSHWLNGPAAADHKAVDARRTGVGAATHVAATLFWAAMFEAWVGHRRPLAPLPLALSAAAMTVVAVAVDYGATPKRFTPGWEFVLSKRSMAFAYAAMGAGFALGAALADRRDRA